MVFHSGFRTQKVVEVSAFQVACAKFLALLDTEPSRPNLVPTTGAKQLESISIYISVSKINPFWNGIQTKDSNHNIKVLNYYTT